MTATLSHILMLASPEDTASFAEWLAPWLRAGDVLLLDGPIGAGKTHFARSLIQFRLAAAGRYEDVPSPTFTLVQVYDAETCDIWHADLYRLGSPREVVELGLNDAFETAICLIEWPDRLGSMTPEKALSLKFSTDDNAVDHRRLVLTAHEGRWSLLFSALQDRSSAA